MKNSLPKVLFIVKCFFVFSLLTLNAQQNEPILVFFEINEKRIPVNFSENISLSISQKGRKIDNVLFYLNGFNIQQRIIDSSATFEVCFHYKRKDYCFDDIGIWKFKRAWVFGIDYKNFKKQYPSFSKVVKYAYYLRFTNDNTRYTQFVCNPRKGCGPPREIN